MAEQQTDNRDDPGAWLRGAVEEVLPDALKDKQKTRRGFDLVALASLLGASNHEKRWRELDSAAAHKKLYGEDVPQHETKDDMLQLGDTNVTINQAAPPPAPQPRAAAPQAAKLGLGAALALATGSGLVGAAVPAAISMLSSSPKSIVEPADNIVLVPELIGDWEKVEAQQ